MTRINIGIAPSELCDQHLVAEYRELPRMVPFAVKRWAKYQGTGPRPTLPTLVAGHMAFFLPYGGWLKRRWLALRDEMTARGFKATLSWREYPHGLGMWFGMSPSFEGMGRTLLQERIRQRLSTMKRATWTGRCRPAWAWA